MAGSTEPYISPEPSGSEVILYHTLGILALCCFVFGSTGNIITLLYFVRKAQPSANRFIFILISLTDLLISFHSFFTGFHKLTGSRFGFSEYPFCVCSGILYSVLSRYSVFLIAVLSFSRCYSLIKPVKPLTPASLLVPSGLYFGVLTLQSTVPFWFGKKYKFNGSHGSCLWYLPNIAPVGTTAFMMLYLFTIILEYTLPLLPVVVSCVIIVYKLHSGIKPTKAKSAAAVTVLVLSGVYIFYNLPVLIFYILDFLGYVYNPDYLEISFSNKLIEYSYIITTTYFVPLNSTSNVIVYILRLRALRSYISVPIRRMFTSVRTTVVSTSKLEL